MTTLGILGHARSRHSCLPSPCSSTIATTRTAANNPPEIEKSHESKLPPGITDAPASLRFDSSSDKRDWIACHCVLHKKTTVGSGAMRVKPFQLHGPIPC